MPSIAAMDTLFQIIFSFQQLLLTLCNVALRPSVTCPQLLRRLFLFCSTYSSNFIYSEASEGNENISSEDIKTIRVSLLSLVKYYIVKDVRNDELTGIVRFLVAAGNEHMVRLWEIRL